MSNILQYVIQLKDKMSGSVAGISSVVEKQLKKIDNTSLGVNKSLGAIQTRISELNRTKLEMGYNSSGLKAINKELDMLQKKADKINNDGVKSGGGGGMGLMGILRGTAIAAGATMAGGAVLKAGMEQEQGLVGLNTFLGKEKSQKVYSQIQQDASSTPFNTKSLLTANRALISAGIDADKARIDVLGLANAISAVGGGNEELQRMIFNMQQIKSKGSADSVDLKQFGMVGIDAKGLIEKLTGKKLAEDAVVTYETLAGALNAAAKQGGMFFGAMEAQSKTTGGLWSTFMDNLEIGAGKAFVKMQPFINEILKFGIKLTQELPVYLDAAIQFIDGFFAPFQSIFNLYGEVSSNFAKTFITNIGNLVNAVRPIIINILNFIMPIMAKLGEKMIIIWERLQPIVLKLVNIFNNLLAPALKVIGFLADKVLDVFFWLVNKIITVADVIITMIDGVVKAIRWATDLVGLTDKDPTVKVTEVKKVIDKQQFMPKKTINWNDGTMPTSEIVNAVSANSTSGKKVGSDVNSITGGGTKNNYITLGKFMDNLNVYVQGVKEGADNAQQQMEDMLLRVLNSSAIAQ